MEHVVFFTGRTGASEFRRVGGLEEAVRLVESLRNEQGVVDVTLHALTPVPVSFRTYYRVEVGAPEPSAAGADASEVSDRERDQPALEPAPHLAPLEVVPALQAEAAAELEPLPQVEPEPEPESEPLPQLAPMLSDDREEYGLLRPEEPFDLGATGFAVPGLVADPPVSAPPLSLLPPPLDSEPVHDLDEPAAVHEANPESAPFEAARFESAPFESAPVDSADEAGDASEPEPLVPQVRPEPEFERSLGYFAN